MMLLWLQYRLPMNTSIREVSHIHKTVLFIVCIHSVDVRNEFSRQYVTARVSTMSSGLNLHGRRMCVTIVHYIYKCWSKINCSIRDQKHVKNDRSKLVWVSYVHISATFHVVRCDLMHIYDIHFNYSIPRTHRHKHARHNCFQKHNINDFTPTRSFGLLHYNTKYFVIAGSVVQRCDLLSVYRQSDYR